MRLWLTIQLAIRYFSKCLYGCVRLDHSAIGETLTIIVSADLRLSSMRRAVPGVEPVAVFATMLVSLIVSFPT